MTRRSLTTRTWSSTSESHFTVLTCGFSFHLLPECPVEHAAGVVMSAVEGVQNTLIRSQPGAMQVAEMWEVDPSLVG